jgi:hypothetical protein
MAEAAAGGGGGGLAIGTSEAEVLRNTRIRDDPADIAILAAFPTLAAKTQSVLVSPPERPDKNEFSQITSLTRATRGEKAETA